MFLALHLPRRPMKRAAIGKARTLFDTNAGHPVGMAIRIHLAMVVYHLRSMAHPMSVNLAGHASDCVFISIRYGFRPHRLMTTSFGGRWQTGQIS